MSAQLEFYLLRAAEAGAAAASSNLANVRDRWLRAQASWLEMASRAGRTETTRINSLAEKSARNSGHVLV